MSIINSRESVAKMERSPIVKELRKEGMHLAFNSVKQRMRMQILYVSTGVEDEVGFQFFG
jgi:hypothetical protein